VFAIRVKTAAAGEIRSSSNAEEAAAHAVRESASVPPFLARAQTCAGMLDYLRAFLAA